MDFEAADRLNGAIRTVAIRHRALTAAHLSRLGLFPGQEAVLLSLDRHGEQTQAQLAAHLNCEPPSITSMVQKLQARGLVERRPSTTDGRAVIVRVTDEGREMVEELKQVWCMIGDETVSELHAYDVETVSTVISALASSLVTTAAHR